MTNNKQLIARMTQQNLTPLTEQLFPVLQSGWHNTAHTALRCTLGYFASKDFEWEPELLRT